jgi:hypothetical protein
MTEAAQKDAHGAQSQWNRRKRRFVDEFLVSNSGAKTARKAGRRDDQVFEGRHRTMVVDL